jgi:hypothetical protein
VGKISKKGMGKQPKVEYEDEEKNPNSNFYSDTSYKIGIKNCMEWSEIYNFFEEGNFKDEYEEYVDDFEDIKKSNLHRVVSRPTIMPYYDMVWWIISHTDIKTCTIVNSSRQVIGSFRPEDIFNMYKLKSKEVSLDEIFLEEFEAKEVNGENIQMDDLIREWWYDPPSFKLILINCTPFNI